MITWVARMVGCRRLSGISRQIAKSQRAIPTTSPSARVTGECDTEPGDHAAPVAGASTSAAGRLEDEVEGAGVEGTVQAAGAEPVGLVVLGERDDQARLDRRDGVVVQPGVALEVDHGRQRLEAVGAHLHVEVRGTPGVAADRGQQPADRAVLGDLVGAGHDGAQLVAAALAHEDPSQPEWNLRLARVLVVVPAKPAWIRRRQDGVSALHSPNRCSQTYEGTLADGSRNWTRLQVGCPSQAVQVQS